MQPGITEDFIARQPPEVQAIIRVLLAENAESKARIEELERRMKGKTPPNSSPPPSSQHPHARPQPPKRKSKKKRGGQPGHEKHERPLIPTNACDNVQLLKPTATVRRLGIHGVEERTNANILGVFAAPIILRCDCCPFWYSLCHARTIGNPHDPRTPLFFRLTGA